MKVYMVEYKRNGFENTRFIRVNSETDDIEVIKLETEHYLDTINYYNLDYSGVNIISIISLEEYFDRERIDTLTIKGYKYYK